MSKISKEVLLEKIGELMNEVASLRSEVQMLTYSVNSGQKPGANYALGGYQPSVDKTLSISMPPKEL